MPRGKIGDLLEQIQTRTLHNPKSAAPGKGQAFSVKGLGARRVVTREGATGMTNAADPTVPPGPGPA